MGQHSSHSEWVLNQVIEIDRDCVGFCGAFLRASAERRHVIADYLAARPTATDQALEAGRFLMGAGHDAILAKAHGVPIPGLRGALRRAGSAVHEERFYSVLQKLLRKPRHPEIAMCVARLNILDLKRLRIANILPEAICRANVVEAISDVSTACYLIDSVNLLVSAGAEEDDLTSAIRSVRNEQSLSRVVMRTLQKCSAPPHPVPETACYRPIRSAQELHNAAAKYQNCARGYSIDFLDEEAGHAFAEFRYQQEGAVVHLRQKRGEWKLLGTYGPRNRRPSSGLRQQVHDYLKAQGVYVGEEGRVKTKWDAVRHFTTTPFFEIDFG